MREGSFDEGETVVSATECTGLLPALSANDDAAENAARLCALHAPKRRKKTQCGKKGKKQR